MSFRLLQNVCFWRTTKMIYWCWKLRIVPESSPPAYIQIVLCCVIWTQLGDMWRHRLRNCSDNQRKLYIWVQTKSWIWFAIKEIWNFQKLSGTATTMHIEHQVEVLKVGTFTDPVCHLYGIFWVNLKCQPSITLYKWFCLFGAGSVSMLEGCRVHFFQKCILNHLKNVWGRHPFAYFPSLSPRYSEHLK